MTTRRGFLGLLAGLVASPTLAPLTKYFPETRENLRAYYSTFYTRKMLTDLKVRTPCLALLKTYPIPKLEGNKIQFFTYPLKGVA